MEEKKEMIQKKINMMMKKNKNYSKEDEYDDAEDILKRKFLEKKDSDY